METALESCGLNFNRVRRQGQHRVSGLLGLAAPGFSPDMSDPQSESIRPDEFSLEIFERFLNKLCLRPDIDKILLEM